MTITTHHPQPLRVTMAWRVLEAAKDAGDREIAAACRRIIRASTLGWRKHGDAADVEMIREFDA